MFKSVSIKLPWTRCKKFVPRCNFVALAWCRQTCCFIVGVHVVQCYTTYEWRSVGLNWDQRSQLYQSNIHFFFIMDIHSTALYLATNHYICVMFFPQPDKWNTWLWIRTMSRLMDLTDWYRLFPWGSVLDPSYATPCSRLFFGGPGDVGLWRSNDLWNYMFLKKILNLYPNWGLLWHFCMVLKKRYPLEMRWPLFAYLL